MDIANVFNNGTCSIPTSLPFQAYPAAVMARKGKIEDGGDWRQKPGEKESTLIVSYEHKNQNGTTFVQFIEEVQDSSLWDHSVANLWKQTTDLSDLDADVYLAMLAQLYNGPKDKDGKTWISVQQILKYRGILPKKQFKDNSGKYNGGYRREDIEAIAACVARMEKVFIQIGDMEIYDEASKGRRKGKRSINYMSRLFVFGDILEHKTLPLDGSYRSIPIAWQYQESTWMYPFLHGDKANRHIGVLIDQILNYDPYHQQWEKRLARFFMFWLRINASHHSKRPVKVRELAQKLNLTVQERYPQQTRDHFEKAMNQLATDGLLTWRYAEDNDTLPARGWLETWLNHKILVDDPPQTKSQYAIIATHANVIRKQNHLLKALKKPGENKETTQKRTMRKKLAEMVG